MKKLLVAVRPARTLSHGALLTLRVQNGVLRSAADRELYKEGLVALAGLSGLFAAAAAEQCIGTSGTSAVSRIEGVSISAALVDDLERIGCEFEFSRSSPTSQCSVTIPHTHLVESQCCATVPHQHRVAGAASEQAPGQAESSNWFVGANIEQSPRDKLKRLQQLDSILKRGNPQPSWSTVKAALYMCSPKKVLKSPAECSPQRCIVVRGLSGRSKADYEQQKQLVTEALPGWLGIKLSCVDIENQSGLGGSATFKVCFRPLSAAALVTAGHPVCCAHQTPFLPCCRRC